MIECEWSRKLRRAVILAGLFASGCQAPRGPVSITSDDTDLQILAMHADVSQRNTSDIARLVVDLQSDDAAIRFYAIQALRRLTRDDFGYRFYDDEDQRAPAVARWKKWLKQHS